MRRQFSIGVSCYRSCIPDLRHPLKAPNRGFRAFEYISGVGLGLPMLEKSVQVANSED